MAWISDFSILNVDVFAQALVTVVCVFLVCKCAQYFFGKVYTERFFKPETQGRRLGMLEEMLERLSVERGGTGNICAAIRFTSKQRLIRQNVLDALVLLAKRQPSLRTVVRNAKNKKKYFEIKDMDEVIPMINLTTSDVNASDWQDHWFEYTVKQFGNGLLWRLVILGEQFLQDTQLYSNTVIFTFKHCITDGESCATFCDQFLSYLNQLANGTICADHLQVSGLNLAPYFHDVVTRDRISHSIVKLVLAYCNIRPILQYAMQITDPHSLQTTKCNPYFAQFPPSVEVSSIGGPSRLMAKVFTEFETKKIAEACKKNKSSVTAAIITAAHLAFCQLIQDGVQKETDLKLRHAFPINARRYGNLRSDENYLGFFVYDFREFYMKYVWDTDVEFWKVAQDITRRINDIVKDAKFIMEHTLSNATTKSGRFSSYDRKALIRESPCNWVSNLGSLNFEESKDTVYKLKECFLNAVGHGSANTFMHFNHTINAKMTWQIAYDVSRIEVSHGEKFANLCFGKFIEFAHGRA